MELHVPSYLLRVLQCYQKIRSSKRHIDTIDYVALLSLKKKKKILKKVPGWVVEELFIRSIMVKDSNLRIKGYAIVDRSRSKGKCFLLYFT